MFLSKIEIAWKHAQNPYNLHKALWKLFPNMPEKKRSFLFREESKRVGYESQVLLQSIDEPKVTLDGDQEGIELLASREFSLQLQPGQAYRFCLRANPVRAVKDKSKGAVVKNGKERTRSARVPLIKEEHQMAWLERKFESCGELENILIQPENPLYFRKKNSGAGKVQSVLFNGIINVTDADVLSDMIIKGIGPAKSFGCGMLSLARA